MEPKVYYRVRKDPQLIPLLVNILQSVLRQVHILLQSQFSTKCDLACSVSIYGIL